MNKIDLENPPPVPPRRKRRRPLPQSAITPNPPSPVNLSRVRKSPAPSLHPAFDSPESNNNTSVALFSRTATSIPIVAIQSPPSQHGNNDKSPRDKLNPPISSMTKPEEPTDDPKSRYPPLFFTLKDFENVMSASMPNKEDTTMEKSSKTTPKSSPNSFFSTNFDNTDNNDDNVLFRVTTTDSPFEKFNDRFGDTFSQAFDSEPPDQFAFDDYIDRSKRFNRKLFSFDDDTIEALESVKRTSKVRFIIEPSDNIPNDTEEDTISSTQEDDLEILNIVNNSESFLGIESEDWWTSGRRSPLKIEEINDQIDPSIDNPEMTSEITKCSEENSSIDPSNPPTSNKIIDSSPSADVIKPEAMNESTPDPVTISPNLDQVSHLRNSFLDKMLSEEIYPGSIDDDTTCSIIAAHPKSKASDLQLADMTIECTSALVKIDENGETGVGEIGASIVGNVPNLRGKNPLVMGKNCGVMKNEVMNELLTNFHSIKLKTTINLIGEKIGNNGVTVIGDTDDAVINSDESLMKSACSVDKKTDDCRLMANINCQYVDNDISHTENIVIINDYSNNDKCCNDKCAIVSCNDERRVNDYDNNAMTHVDLSYDQYREDFMIAITPGRVRSFVKNYEISVNETSDYYECNEGVNDGHWQSPSVGRCDVWGAKRGVNPCLKTEICSGGWGKKKSVKFDGCHTVIQGDDGVKGVKVKRRAPVRPPMGGSEGSKVGGIVDVYEKVQRMESIGVPSDDSQGYKKQSQVDAIGNEKSTLPGTSTSKTTLPPFLKPPYVFYLKV